ncbi:MAG TPA: ATP-binding protein [Gemmatimonadales bacterium]|nr:ATP-binding protein [Gemmatimonadales bacterium]
MTAPLSASLRLCVRRRRVPSASGAMVQVSLRVPSDVACIEEVIDLLTRHCCSESWLCRRSRFNFRVAMAEALANAIVAGNREDRSKWVKVEAELHCDQIQVEVTDQGPGFDPTRVTPPLDPEELDSPNGRGLFLIRQLVDDVRFNPQGNSICMTLRRH